jgi:signal transduction histidine kinase
MISVLLLVLYLFTIGLSAYSCGWLLLKAERSGAAAALAVCQLLVIVWCIPQLFLGLPMTKGIKYLIYGISYMGISFIGPSWLAFSFLYCKKKLARPIWLVLFGLALLHYMVFLTNERHHLFYRQFEVEAVVYGRMFYVHMAYTYCCVAGGMGAVLRDFWKKRVAAVHLAVILLSAAVPLAFNILYLSGWAKTSFDLTPLAFSLSGFLMVLAVLRYDFLDVRGLTFEQILSSIAEGVAVYNKRGMIVYCNKAANDWLGICEGDTFEKVRERLEGLGIQVEREKERILEDLLLSLDGGGKIRLKQYIQRDKTGATAAGIFLLTDVGEYYERLRQSRELAVSAQKLAIEQERNRIAQKVHDTAGHTLTMIQSLVRLARVEWERSQSVSEEKITWYGELTQLAGERRFEKISEKEAVREGETSSGEGRMEEYLSQAQELAVEGIRELRISINQLRQGTEGELVTQGVYHLAQRVKELDVEVSVQGTDGLSYSHLSTVVYECLREAITNCLKYAHASHMDVILKFEENGLRVYIFDDGQGCQSIVEDNGLRGIRDRVTEAGGQVRILSSEGEGFQIYIWLPMEQEP